jgi:hypothetical protein
MEATVVKVAWSAPGSGLVMSDTIVGYTDDAYDLAAEWAESNGVTLITVTTSTTVTADDGPVKID